MAVKKATTKKVAKKAPAKKVAAKKAVAKKAPAKKVAAKKAVAKKAPAKKVAAKKAVAKKAPAKKVAAKKAVAKKAPAKKAPARLNVGTFDVVPEVPFAERVSRPTPSLPSKSNSFQDRTVDLPVNTVEKKRSKTPAALAFLVLVGLASYVLINANSTDSSSEPTVAASPMETSAPEVSASPVATPTPEVTEEPSTPPAVVVAGDLSTSFIYTSTGIRLEWKINGADASTITVSKSQDGGDYRTLSTLTGDARTLDITKTDTKGWTRFRVTVVTDNGDSLSSTVGLRGKFTL